MKPEYSVGAFTGFLESLPNLLSDYVFGGETAIKGVVRNSLSDWRPEIPAPKSQLMKVRGIAYGDTNGCVSFSGTNTVAAQMDWLIERGQIDADGFNFLHSQGYIDSNGKVDISPRFTATMSGTDPHRGNIMTKVWDSMRNDGVVPDADWAMPEDAILAALPSGMDAMWAAYYSPTSDVAKAKGKLFAQWFDIKYEWVAWPGRGGAENVGDFRQLLSVAPVQIATAVCKGWNTDKPIMACGAGSAHATTLLYAANYGYDILDHYIPYLKTFASSYDMTWAIRGVVTQKPHAPAAPSVTKPASFTHDYQVNLFLGAGDNADVHALQQGLQTLKDKEGKPYMKEGVFGPFGPQTKDALERFQADHDIIDAGEHFGPQTRAALTQALKDVANK